MSFMVAQWIFILSADIASLIDIVQPVYYVVRQCGNALWSHILD